MTTRNHLIFSCATKFRACARWNRYHITVNPQSYVNKLSPLILNVRNPFASCTTCEDISARRNLPKHVHTRGFRRTQIQTEKKKVLIWRVSLNQNLDQPSLVLLQQLFQKEWSLLTGKGEKGKRKCKKVDNYFSSPSRRTIKHDTYNYRAQIFKQNRSKTTLISVTKI